MTPEEVRVLLTLVRYQNRLSQRELAEKIKTVQSHISDLETGVSSPTLETLVKWVEGLEHEVVIQRRKNHDTTN